MARTIERETYTIVGGPYNDLLVDVKVMSTGERKITVGELFFPEGELALYDVDHDAKTITLKALDERIS